jgi:hypothetical protein
MRNLDNARVEMQVELKEAFASGDENRIAEAMTALAGRIQNGLLEEARAAARDEAGDGRAMAQRGHVALTSAERKYYNAVIEGRGFDGVEELVPPTVINRVFDELVGEYPLLEHIRFVNAGAATQWIRKRGKVNTAYWGNPVGNIREILDGGFETLNLGMFKLSGYMPVHNAMLDLGPEWLDRYVRTVLTESLSIGLETGIVAGTGKEMPVGMIMDMKTFDADKGYAPKTAVKLVDLDPKTIGKEIMAPLTKKGSKVVTKNGANGIIYVVNPLDYWTKIFPATTPFVDAQGLYRYHVMPLPGTFVQSVAMPEGRMAVGKGKDYFMGVGTNRRFEKLKELRALEDETVYLARMYGNGKPDDNESFLYFDITGLKPA